MRNKYRKQNDGFTLGELLIVIAIIAVLVAISIPIFTSQLEKAREAADAANIRAQYGEVMSEALTSEENVKGNELYGTVKLQQKKNGWNNDNLKKNLEGVFTEIVGEEPKAGGTAWVEYDWDNEKSILHYEGSGGSDNNASDNTDSDPANAVQKKLIDSAKPLDTSKDINVSIGEVYSYNNKIYVSLSQGVLKAGGTPEKGSWYQYNFVTPTQVVHTSKELDNRGVIPGKINYGDLYQADDGTIYICKGNSDYGLTAPTRTEGNWVAVLA